MTVSDGAGTHNRARIRRAGMAFYLPVRTSAAERQLDVLNTCEQWSIITEHREKEMAITTREQMVRGCYILGQRMAELAIERFYIGDGDGDLGERGLASVSDLGRLERAEEPGAQEDSRGRPVAAASDGGGLEHAEKAGARKDGCGTYAADVNCSRGCIALEAPSH